MEINNKIIEQLELHQLWVKTIGKQGRKLGIDEIDLRNIDLTNYTLDQAYITECIFSNLNLQKKTFIYQFCVLQFLNLQI
ncbi:hypothetical protein QKW52_15060 [Bacillus sonorensis]|nr:hypothetical protein [Bacillus sonorensis]